MNLKNKKIVYILNSYSANEASHFHHVLNLLVEMANHGCDIILIVEKMYDKPKLYSSNIKVVGLKFSKFGIRHMELFLRLIHLRSIGFKKFFVRITAGTSIITSVVARLSFADSYLWQSGTTYFSDRERPISLAKVRWYFFSYIPNYFARKLTKFFVTGPESMVEHYSKYVGVKRKKIKLLYNDVDLKRFNGDDYHGIRKQFLKSHNLCHDSKVILSVHRLSPVRKTLKYLYHILESTVGTNFFNECVFIFVGGGPELEQAKSLVEDYGLTKKFIFLGDQPNNLIPKFYSMADIFINPSYTEGFPRVIIEAMAHSLPIVTTDAGGTGDILPEEQMPFIISNSDFKGFSEALEHLLSTKDYAFLGKHNRELVKKFDTKFVATQYIKEIFY